VLTAIALTLWSLATSISPQAQDGVITGYIRHTDGRPVAATRVAAIRDFDDAATGRRSTESAAWTDTAGSYRLEDIPTGRYRIRVGPLDRTVFTVTTSAQDPFIVDVSPGARIDRDLVVPSEFEVRGRLLDYSPIASRHTTISLTDSALGPGRTAVVRPDGSFRFSGVPRGRYRVSFGSDAPAIADVLVVVEDRDVEGLELDAAIPEELTARIEVEGGIPIPQQLSLNFSGPEGSFRTDRLRDDVLGLTLPRGTYRTTAAGVPDDYAVLALSAGDRDLLTEPMIVDGSATREVTIRFGPVNPDRWHGVRGQVTPPTDPSGDPGFVLLLSPSYAPLRAPVQSDGSFEFPNVPVGPWDLRVYPGGATVQRRVDVGKDLASLDVSRPGTAEVSGRVVIDGGLPLPPLSVRFDGGAGARLARTEADGTFYIQLSEGEYAVLVDLPESFRVRSATFGSVDLLEEPLDLVGTDLAEFEIVVEPNQSPPPMRSVRGRVVDASNLPASRLAVVLQSQETVTFPPRRAEIRTDGTFVFEDVYPGQYLVRQERFDLAAVEWEGVNVVVEDDDVDGVRLIVPPQIRLRGRVVVGDGQPLPSVGMMFGRVHNFSALPVSPDGSFEVTMPPGSHQVVLTRIPDGYALPSIAYGAIDASAEPLVLTGSSPDELRIVFGSSR